MNLNEAKQAEARARASLEQAPTARAWDALAAALGEQGLHEEALHASEQALHLDPSLGTAAFKRAISLNHIGRSEEAAAVFASLRQRGATNPAIWLNEGGALLAVARDAEAERIFAEGVARWPANADLHGALATARWLLGAGETFTAVFEAAVARDPDDALLRRACADLLRRGGFTDKARALLNDGLSRTADHSALLALRGAVLMEEGDPANALPDLQRAAMLSPDVSAIRAALTSTLLSLGRPHDALALIEQARLVARLNQEWIAYLACAYRQLGDPRYRRLCDYDRMVRVFDLPAPDGYASADAFNAALQKALAPLHVRSAHPLDQSLRQGSQTSRSLTHSTDSAIRAYLQALDAPIRAYMREMPADDPQHPWSGRNTGAYAIAGAWSVKLKPQGYHVNHVHPEGWISSAYYVSLPESVAAGADQQGWIKFGEPRWPMPGCDVEKVVQPQVGRLVLFPSYMWHGTIPFSEGERITAPFDVVPA